ncbi:hypothetical protein [Phycicoccus sp. Root101]|nr:hypothetical protein [Phycicoccus sp. Root101]
MDTRRLTGRLATPALLALHLIIVFAVAQRHILDGIATSAKQG